MGGIGRTQDIEKTRMKEPSKRHWVKNVKSKDPYFKIGNQKLVSQSFAADLLQEEKHKDKQQTEPILINRKTGVYKKIQRV